LVPLSLECRLWSIQILVSDNAKERQELQLTGLGYTKIRSLETCTTGVLPLTILLLTVNKLGPHSHPHHQRHNQPSRSNFP
ncbi:hypothetical protein LINPERHAP1_LOCUS18341, partial [Linum perenne]